MATWWRSDSRRAIQRSLLRLLTVAHRERLDVAPLVANFAEEHRGWTRRRLRQLGRRLAANTSLVDALEQTPGVLSQHDLLAIRFAIQSGTLNQALPDLIHSPWEVSSESRARLRAAIGYGVVLILISSLIAAFLVILILPTLVELDRELGRGRDSGIHSITAVTSRLDEISQWLLAAILIAGLLWVIGPTRRLMRRLMSPLASRIATRSRAAEVLRLLSYAIDAGRPESGAISTLARYHFDAAVRRKLLLVRNEVEHGADLWTCLTEAHLVTSPEAHAIRKASTAPLQAWTLRQLADARASRWRSHAEGWMALAQPLTALLLAAFVLWLSSSVFQFLSQLVHWHATI